MIPVLEGFRKLFLPRNREIISRYPSSKTPELRRAWEQPLVKYNATVQQYASPLSITSGNAVLNGEDWEMRREYREWSFREPSVKAALLTSCISVASLDKEWTPANPDDTRDAAACEWVKYTTERIRPGGLGGLIQSMLLAGRIDGFAVLEKCYGEIESGPYKGYWEVPRYAMLDTEHLRFKLDQYRQVIGIRPMTGFTGYQELPPEGFLIYTHLKMFENPFGISELRAVVRDCRCLEAAYKLRNLLLANWSGPFLTAKANDDATRRQMLGILERARASGYIVIPSGVEIEVLNLATSSPQVFDATIQSYRENIVQAIQGAYLQLLTGQVSDARGDTQVHKDVSELFTWWLAMWVCEVINLQLVPDLVRPNFGNDVGLPRLSLGGIDVNMVNAELDKFKRGQELGVPISLKQVRTMGGFEKPLDQFDILKPPQSQQQGAPGLDQLNPSTPFSGKGGAAPVAATFCG